MTPEQFCYWLQGAVEHHAAENGNKPPSMAQWKAIVDHLQTVFKKETPTYTMTINPYDTGTRIC